MSRRRLLIRGSRWTVAFRPPPRTIIKRERLPDPSSGLCQYSTRRIWAEPDEDLRSTLLHEVVHACLPDLKGETVIQIEQALEGAMRLLDKRNPQPPLPDHG